MAVGDKFFIADKATLDDVNSKVGATNNTGGTASAGTLFGKLNAIISSIATHVANWTEARAENLDATVSSRQSESSAASRYNTLNTNTGVNNTASATGTLSQKLSHLIADVLTIKNWVQGGGKKQKSYHIYQANLSAGTFTLLNVVGQGVFHGGYCGMFTNSYVSAMTVTVDGVAYAMNPNTATYYLGRFLGINSPIGLTNNTNFQTFRAPYYFQSSLKIEVTFTGNPSTANERVFSAAYDLFE